MFCCLYSLNRSSKLILFIRIVNVKEHQQLCCKCIDLYAILYDVAQVVSSLCIQENGRPAIDLKEKIAIYLCI